MMSEKREARRIVAILTCKSIVAATFTRIGLLASQSAFAVVDATGETEESLKMLIHPEVKINDQGYVNRQIPQILPMSAVLCPVQPQMKCCLCPADPVGIPA